MRIVRYYLVDTSEYKNKLSHHSLHQNGRLSDLTNVIIRYLPQTMVIKPPKSLTMAFTEPKNLAFCIASKDSLSRILITVKFGFNII